ncbi:hypothetical protein NBRC116599_39470 [Aquicoccus sp. SU-CL01552]
MIARNPAALSAGRSAATICGLTDRPSVIFLISIVSSLLAGVAIAPGGPGLARTPDVSNDHADSSPATALSAKHIQ